MDALMYLEPVLRSKKEQLTPQEVYLMQEWRARARRDFAIGSTGGVVVSWLATKRLARLPRLAVTAVAGATCGIWLFARSLESTVDYLLSLQGTRLQGELANIMLKKHQNDPWVQKRVFKYFYPEIVYTDSSTDRPVHRWRHRNFFGETPRQITPESGGSDTKDSDVKMTSKETKKNYANDGGETATAGHGNPFDSVFGLSEIAEDFPSQKADGQRLVSRRQTRKEKRRRRRHRQQHNEDSEI